MRRNPHLNTWKDSLRSRKRKLALTWRAGINEIPFDVYFYFGHGWPFLWHVYFSLLVQDAYIYYMHDVPFCKEHTFNNDMTNTCFSWNPCNNQNFIAFVIYDFCFHDDVYNYNKFTSTMVKKNTYVLVYLCMWPTSSTSKFWWEIIVISTKTFKLFYI